MESPMVSMNIDKGMVDALVKQNVRTAMLSALGTPEQKASVLDAIVMEALELKVDDKGNISRYQSDNKYSYLEFKVQSVIRGAVKEALDEFVEKEHSTIKRQVKKAMQDNASDIANELVKSFAESASSGWRYKVGVNVFTKDD